MKYVPVFVLIAVLFSGCALFSSDSSSIQSFSSLQEFEAFISSENPILFREDRLFESLSSSAPSTISGLDTSGTNVQVAGVDEADIVKVVNDLVFTVTDNTLFVIRAYPGDDAVVLSRTSINGSGLGLFVDDNIVVVLSSSRGTSSFGRRWFSESISVEFFDSSSPSELTRIDSFLFSGSYVDARLLNGVLYLIEQSWPSASSSLPVHMHGAREFSLSPRSISYLPIEYSSHVLSSVHAISLSDRDIHSLGVLTPNTPVVYMSHDNLFLVSAEHINQWDVQTEETISVVEPLLSSQQRSLVRRIRAVDSDIFSDQEKTQRVAMVMEQYLSSLSETQEEEIRDRIESRTKERMLKKEFFDSSHIVRVSLSPLSVDASGVVPGTVNNQFSLDEQDGVLRITTTTQRMWFSGETLRESENHVFTLDSSLSVLDSLMGLAPTERIFSARYTPQRLYLVTFDIVDPFFVIDLSSPRDIRLLGELKIEGFSRYLHPLDENTVIGFGRDANEFGAPLGLKISLFDVRDVHNPVETASWISDRGVFSSAEFEHHAFLFNKERELLVIPASSHRPRDDSYVGAFVFHIDSQNISLRGLIDHSAGGWHPVQRSFFIEELLYTKSPYLLRIHQLSELSSVHDLQLAPLAQTDIPLY